MKTDSHHLRLISIADQADMLAIMEALSGDFFHKDIDKRRLAEKIAAFGCMKAAYIGGELAGFVGYYANDTVNRVGYLTTIVVAGQYQGRGVGSALLHECLRDCREKGMTSCRLEVDRNNTSALRFYCHFGFFKEGKATEMTDYYCRSLSGNRSKTGE